MNKLSAYNALLNKFGKKLESMIQSDFPGNPDLTNDIDMAMTKIQFLILSEFLKGESK